MAQSMSYNAAAGLGGMLKQGHVHLQDETKTGSVVSRNIVSACELTRMMSTSLGPMGRCKLVVNALEKVSVTSDCASILSEIQVEHPAAKLLEQACQRQQEECGDGTNLTLSFAGELLWQIHQFVLPEMGGWHHASDVLEGYRIAARHLPKLLKEQCCDCMEDMKDKQQLLRVLRPVLATKQYGMHEPLADLVAEACMVVMTKHQVAVTSSEDGDGNSPRHVTKYSVQPEAVRTVKILGSSIASSSSPSSASSSLSLASSGCFLVEGYVAQRAVETTMTKCENAKIVVFACGMEASSTEAKGTVLMKTADDLKNYNKTEERKMQDIIQSIADSGCTVVVTGGSISDMALHFLNRHNILALKIGSKWELRRLCQATNATALVRLGPATPDEMGFAERVEQVERGGTLLTVFSNPASSSTTKSKLATIVLRASTRSVLADLERAVDDGVRAVQMACRDGRLVYGGGAVEMALSVALHKEADCYPGLEQYAIRAFARALEFVPRTLADNGGLAAEKVIAELRASHANCAGDEMGVDILANMREDAGNHTGIVSMKQLDVVDLLATKLSALRLAVDAALTVLKIDQIIMSKPSGGPKPQG